jgi:hypothetical protein
MEQESSMSTTRVADLTVEEFRELLREIVQETIGELLADCDPDVGLKFRPDVAEYLTNALKEKRPGIPLNEVEKEPGLDDEE